MRLSKLTKKGVSVALALSMVVALKISELYS